MNKLMKIIPVVLVVCMVLTVVFADVSTNFPTGGSGIGNVNTAARKIWGTVLTVVQILAFAAIVFSGVRYMFASADQKADIKKSMGILAIGAILVFAASSLVQFIVNAANDVL